VVCDCYNTRIDDVKSTSLSHTAEPFISSRSFSHAA